jgi:hypothetical protein
MLQFIVDIADKPSHFLTPASSAPRARLKQLPPGALLPI